MKADRTTKQPAFNLLKNDGQAPQADNQVITKVFMNNGTEFDVVPGSFKFYITAGDRPQPFVQFQTWLSHTISVESSNNDKDLMVRNVNWKLHTVEVFPASVAGVAFLTAEEDTNE